MGNFKLVQDFLLIKKEVKDDSKTRGGIYLTGDDANTDSVARAEVISMSDNVADNGVFSIGDIVTYAKQCFLMQITIDGREYHTIHKDEIIGYDVEDASGTKD